MGLQMLDVEYVLPPDAESVWVTVGNISVHVERGDDGVSVTLYPVGKETEALTETRATYDEARNV